MQGSSLFFMEMGMNDKTRSQCLEILTHCLTLYRRILECYKSGKEAA